MHGMQIAYAQRHKPKFTCCVTSRHDKHEMSCESWRDVLFFAVSCVLRRACSNVADDEEAVVLASVACKTISCCYYFSSQIKLIRLLKRITAIITLYTLQTNSCVSRLSRSWWRTCHACCRLQYARHSTYDFFLYQNACSRRDATGGMWAILYNLRRRQNIIFI